MALPQMFDMREIVGLLRKTQGNAFHMHIQQMLYAFLLTVVFISGVGDDAHITLLTGLCLDPFHKVCIMTE